MSNSVKKTIIMKRINNVLYNIFPKSSADNIVYNDDGTTTTVQSKIDEISSALASTITSSQASSLIQQESTSLYNRIMGFSDSDTTINEAYDTLKEVATYLAGHGSVVSGFTTDINNLKTTVGGSSSGLVKDVNDLKTTVGGSSSGLVKGVNDNTNAIGALQTTANGKSTVTSSNTNGNIKINGTETTVYTPSNIPASAITESDTKKFVTNDEKNRISSVGSVNVVSSAPSSANDTDLYLQILSNEEYTQSNIELLNMITQLINRAIAFINIPSGVTSIGDNAFAYCTSLTSVTIPSSVTTIGTYAFTNCTSLTSVTIPSSVTSIDNSAFQFCSGLTSINIPSSVTSIGDNAFRSCKALTSVTIENGVTYIDNGAFRNCSDLTSITIPSSVTSIGSGAFSGCSGLEFVTLENGFNANNLDLSASTKYSVETIVSWLNALYDRTGLSSYKLTIGSTNLNKLTAEQKAIATNKNWTLA